MKLISLNTWGGRAGIENFLEFLKKHQDVDIFCLQEVWNGGEHMLGVIDAGSAWKGATPQLLKRISEVLPEHGFYFRPQFYDFYGLAVFIKKSLTIVSEGEQFVYKERGYISPKNFGDHARNIQYVTFNTTEGPRTVINIHGIWRAGAGKVDLPDRILQSENIVTFLKTLSNPFVLCGDFNLLPETKSIQILESAGLRNLIKENKITSTRTRFYEKSSDTFADYAFTSKGIEVKDFKVLSDEVSDHNPMYLEFI